jgi:hypothetical protein
LSLCSGTFLPPVFAAPARRESYLRPYEETFSPKLGGRLSRRGSRDSRRSGGRPGGRTCAGGLDRVGFTGEHRSIYGSMRTLPPDLDNKISSMHVRSGNWCLYDIWDFDPVNGPHWRADPTAGGYAGNLTDPRYNQWGRSLNDRISSIELRAC